MPRFSRSEVEDAFAHLWQVGCVEEDWNSWIYKPGSDLALKAKARYVEATNEQSEVCRRLFRLPFSVVTGPAGTGKTRLGGYVSTTYKLGQRWIAGARWDYVEDGVTGLITRQLTPSLTLWESEWVFLRGQYSWSKLTGTGATGQVALQAVWAIGPHKHEIY